MDSQALHYPNHNQRISEVDDLNFQYEIEDDLYQKSNDIIDEYLGEEITEDQREELLNLILLLFKRNIKHQNQMIFNDRNTLYLKNPQNLNNPIPCINIYLITQANSGYPSNIANYQQQMNTVMTSSPYFINNSPYLYPMMPVSQPQFVQQPNFNYYQTIHDMTPSKKSHKTKPKSHKKKDHKKSNKKVSKHKKTTSESKSDDSNIHTFLYTPGSDFDGIIKYLTDKTGGNIHDNGTIDVTSNSIYQGDHPKYLLQSSSDHGSVFQSSRFYRATSNKKDFWVCFNFKDMLIEISDYTIKSAQWGPNNGHIRSWIMEVSDDGSNWTEIDKQTDCKELNGSFNKKTFHVKIQIFAKYCRIRHTGDYYGKSYNSPTIEQIEFFGRLKDNKK